MTQPSDAGSRMPMSNPSAVLVARSSRSPNNLSAALSSPTETHAAAAGIFRSSASSPPWSFEEFEGEDVSELEVDDDEEATEAIETDETFTRRARYPGTVKIVVEKTTFWAHREILVFASPFFEAALSGSWSETGRPASMSSIITISRPPANNTPESILENSNEAEFQRVENDSNDVNPDTDAEKSDAGNSSGVSESDNDTGSFKKEHARVGSLQKLQGSGTPSGSEHRGSDVSRLLSRQSRRVSKLRAKRSKSVDAVIVLKEEKAPVFHDFLKHAYPNLTCITTWQNVEGLMNISRKLVVPSLQELCSSFLLTHAAGKPIMAMRLAELYDEEIVYRESSRFVLDNPGGWEDIATLSEATQLKLERKRTWFLERVVKLGFADVAKDYQCCSTCPDPAGCARLLDEKWKQGYNAAVRTGTCQPSILWRSMRMLEVSPPLALTHLACQNTAKNFAATLFDRMFSLGMRGTGTDSLSALRAGVAPAAHARHFLYCNLREAEKTPKTKKKRDIP